MKFRRRALILSILLVTVLLLSSCGLINKRIAKINENKEVYTVNKGNATQLCINDTIYQITNDSINENNIDNWIGIIKKMVFIDENYTVQKEIDIKNPLKFFAIVKEFLKNKNAIPFVNVYEIKDCDADEYIAIDINGEYKKAVIFSKYKDEEIIDLSSYIKSKVK